MSATSLTDDSHSLSFWKMEGCGNNFVVCSPERILNSAQAKRLCERHFGIGADGLMAVYVSPDLDLDFEVMMFNPDGSSMGMCGNGIRCVALYVVEKGLTTKNQISFLVEGRTIVCTVEDRTVHVDMGPPLLSAQEIPLAQLIDTESFPLSVGEHTFAVTAVSMGNPHAVIFVESLPLANELKEWGSALEYNPLFPSRTNVEFVRIIDTKTLEVVVWERGAGATMACGTAACASVVAGVRRGMTENIVEVKLPGGTVLVHWDRSNNTVILSGYARKVFEGVIGNIWN